MASDAANRYMPSYIAFMRECKDAFADLGREIEAGNVDAGNSCTVQITVPAKLIDQIRFEYLTAFAEVNDG